MARGLLCSLTLSTTLHWRSSESKGDAVVTEDLNLEELLELGPEVNCFLQGLAKSSEEENDEDTLP